MANYRGITEVIVEKIEQQVKPTEFPLGTPAALQSGQDVRPSERVTYRNQYFKWGVSAWGLAAISPIYKPEQPTK